MYILGISCTSSAAFFTTVRDGDVDPTVEERVQHPTGLDDGAAFVALLHELRRLLRALKPDDIVLLKPEQFSGSYKQHRPRAAIETIVLMAAKFEEIPAQSISRQKVRSKLDLPRKGGLDTHVATVCEPVGKYWNAGRGLAALAALATSEA